MQGHGDHHLGRGRERLGRLLVGGGFVVVGVYAAEESLCHILHLDFIIGPLARSITESIIHASAPAVQQIFKFL